MRNTVRVLALVIACMLCSTTFAWAVVDSVWVVSQDNVAPGVPDTIGIYISNSVPITGIVLPLEIRSWSGGAFIQTLGGTAAQSFKYELNPAGRMYNSPLGPADPGGAWPAASPTIQKYPLLTDSTPGSGDCTRSFYLQGQANPAGKHWAYKAAAPDFTDPDALLMAIVSTGDPGIGELISMDAGTDAPGVPSIRIVCKTGASTGIFVIDTTCITPANHAVFVDETTNFVHAGFGRGAIGINVPAGVRDIESGSAVPSKYGLDQNYPNPFNAGTNIRFTTLTDGRVTLDVYNVLGQKVRTLVNQDMASGTHEADWDGRDGNGNTMSTGVYFYRIQAKDFVSTRKMVMIK